MRGGGGGVLSALDPTRKAGEGGVLPASGPIQKAGKGEGLFSRRGGVTIYERGGCKPPPPPRIRLCLASLWDQISNTIVAELHTYSKVINYKRQQMAMCEACKGQ